MAKVVSRLKLAAQNSYKITLAVIVCIFFIIFLSSYRINNLTKLKVYDDITLLPKNKVGLILGTGKFTKDGRINLYYKYRINAAVKLFEDGKIEYILVSGDNSREGYDEPSDFKNDLINKGIPEDKIFLDYAGFRTLDSVVRAKKVFGLDSVTIISQKFHNQRAIYLANHFHLAAVGFNAENVEGSYSLKTSIRECLARTKAIIDVLLNIQPKYLGKAITIP